MRLFKTEGDYRLHFRIVNKDQSQDDDERGKQKHLSDFSEAHVAHKTFIELQYKCSINPTILYR